MKDRNKEHLGTFESGPITSDEDLKQELSKLDLFFDELEAQERKRRGLTNNERV